ncbi:MAG: MobA/MobL family protein [Candidatus Competibacter sp.]
MDNRWSVLCLPRLRGQTGKVAIYSLHLRSVGRTTHAPRTAGAHIRYITRPEARADLLAGRMPIERHAARRWLDREERRDRQNARVIDKLTVALPRELDALQRRGLVMAFAERVTQGRAAWFAAIHQSGRDAHNPHAHIVIRDRDPETGRRVALLSEKGACRRIRLLWEQAVNAALEAQGSAQRVTRRSHADRGIETPPQRHRGPQRQEDEREEENRPGVPAPASTVGLAFEIASGKRLRVPRPFVPYRVFPPSGPSIACE